MITSLRLEAVVFVFSLSAVRVSSCLQHEILWQFSFLFLSTNSKKKIISWTFQVHLQPTHACFGTQLIKLSKGFATKTSTRTEQIIVLSLFLYLVIPRTLHEPKISFVIQMTKVIHIQDIKSIPSECDRHMKMCSTRPTPWIFLTSEKKKSANYEKLQRTLRDSERIRQRWGDEKKKAKWMEISNSI